MQEVYYCPFRDFSVLAIAQYLEAAIAIPVVGPIGRTCVSHVAINRGDECDRALEEKCIEIETRSQILFFCPPITPHLPIVYQLRFNYQSNVVKSHNANNFTGLQSYFSNAFGRPPTALKSHTTGLIRFNFFFNDRSFQMADSHDYFLLLLGWPERWEAINL
ncbi:hypothetical protein [Microcoleus sp. LAD1_D1]|uniref:hypothetical protein n=1 Tax=unclassified Microcoleus TaxID=2642155 RepID=UPI00403F74A2